MRYLFPLVLLFACLAILPGCGAQSDATEASTITASVLIEPADAPPEWFRDVKIPDGSDGFDLLKAAVGDNLQSEWFPAFRSHFVSQIFGHKPADSAYWGVFLWNDNSRKWEPLAIGADLLSVKNDHVMGWAVVEYDPGNPQLPDSIP